MKDFTAGHISQADADALIATLQQNLAASHQCLFHAGVSYRNLLFLAQAAHMKLKTTAPHDISGQLVDPYLPHGEGQERIRALMQEAERLLVDHPVNRRRRELNENWATHIWLWGQGVPVALEPLESLGLKGAVITAVDIIRGIALGMGMKFIPVEGATGFIDTDYQAKGRAAIRALEEYDLVVVHIEAPDESAHQGMIEEKVKSLERIDEAIVGPILEQLQKYDEYRILVAPDHATLLNSKGHDADPPPFAFAGTGVIAAESERGFSEKDARAARLLVEPGHTLWKKFLNIY
jgi:2,3-bisphosphoglycerate-independent phosphoglycerate mutase